jgi:hypothetical protein
MKNVFLVEPIVRGTYLGNLAGLQDRVKYAVLTEIDKFPDRCNAPRKGRRTQYLNGPNIVSASDDRTFFCLR